MIAIGEVLVSDEVVTEHFLCDLNKCKGGCCVDGDCGAPLTKQEVKILKKEYKNIRSVLHPQHASEIDKQGTAVWDDEFKDVTPTIKNGICAYGFYDEAGIVKCGIEKAWKQGLTSFRKPISCHLYPIRIKQMRGYEVVNYEPRLSLCRAACKLGDKVKLPVYRFLKDAITRYYGEDFYVALDAAALKMANETE